MINLPPEAVLYPPLPAISIVAKGKFTQEEAEVAYHKGVALRFEFHFDGGAVTGSGTVPRLTMEYPNCTFTEGAKSTYSGTFDPLTRQITGSVETTWTSTVPSDADEACRQERAETTTSTRDWTAQVSEDAKHISGSVHLPNSQEDYPFVGTISEAG